MQSIKISIEGDYFDSHIYRGRLYLWTFDGELNVYDWTSLVNSFIKVEKDRLSLSICFLDGNYLYKKSLTELFKDSDFKKLLIKKFKRLENLKLEISKDELKKFEIGSQNVPTNILPTDTEIFGNKLYFINEKGLFSTPVHKNINNKYLVGFKPQKHWDCNLLSIKANKYPQLALSGGSDGLFELNMANSLPTNLKRVENLFPIFQVSDKHSSFSNYSHLNIYNTSLVDDSFFAMFKWDVSEDTQGATVKKIFERNFDQNVSDKQIFSNTTSKRYFSWGIEDKIYMATDLGLDIIKYNNFASSKNGQERFKKLNSFNLNNLNGKIINGGSSFFGNILELENALIIIKSNEEILEISGAITKWRIFPRSINYENHLHVIHDDRIEIYSFNHDYFLNQDLKNIGIQFITSKEKNNFGKSDTFSQSSARILPN